MSKNMKRLSIGVIVLVLVSLPLFLYKGGYIVGGDDTKLYYVFPEMFLKNYAFSIISDNTLAGANSGYFPVSYFAPMFLFLWVLKLVPLNTQFLAYGLNLAIGFLFTYKLLQSLRRENSVLGITSYLIASLTFIFSPFLIGTLYKHQLLSMYLISVIPATIYFVSRAIREDKVYLNVLGVLIFSLFSTTLNSLPWIAGFVVASLPLIIYLLIHQKNFIKHSLIACVSFLALNFYWIFFFIHSQIFGQGLSTTTQTYSSNDFIGDNLRIIESVSRMFSPLSQVFQNFLPNALLGFKLENLVPVTVLIVIVVGLIKVKQGARIYIYIVAALLLSWFLISPNMGSFGPKLFVFMSRSIPFFTMFRNMFDKFSLPLAFYYSLSFGLALVILGKSKSYLVRSLLLMSGVVVISVMGRSLLQQNSKWTNYFSGEFNSDYMSLIEYLKEQPDESRVLWLPLNGPTYANIEDANNAGSYYSGLSPLHLLSGRSDYAGRFSFITPSDIYFGEKVFNSIKAKNYEEVGEALMMLNAKYIIVDKQVLPKDISDFMYGGVDSPMLKMQNEEFYTEILGGKIRDFGNRYSLYLVNQKYQNDRIYIADGNESSIISDSGLKYRKISSNEYLIQYPKSQVDRVLVFLDPYYRNWHLEYSGKNGNLNLDDKQSIAFEYANAWSIESDEISRINTEGDYVELRLKFKPAAYSAAAYIVSIIAFATSITIIIYGYKKRRIL